MFFDKLSKREKTLIGCFALMLTFYFYYQWVLVPRIEALKTEKARSQELTAILIKSRAAAAQLPRWRTAVAKAVEEEKRLPLPRTTDLGLFLQDLNGIATMSKVKISSVVPAEKTDEMEYSKVSVSIGLTGTYSEMSAFFDSLRRSGSPFITTGVSLGRGAGEGGVQHLSMDITGFTLLNKAGGLPDAGR